VRLLSSSSSTGCASLLPRCFQISAGAILVGSSTLKVIGEQLMWLRKCGQVVRSYRILCPEGPARNASRSDAGGDYRAEPGVSTPGHLYNRARPIKGGRNSLRISFGIQGGKRFSTATFRAGALFYPYPGLKMT
jgi:hypothetical protein